MKLKDDDSRQTLCGWLWAALNPAAKNIRIIFESSLLSQHIVLARNRLHGEGTTEGRT